MLFNCTKYTSVFKCEIQIKIVLIYLSLQISTNNIKNTYTFLNLVTKFTKYL